MDTYNADDSILRFADDNALIADSSLQAMFDTVNDWLSINVEMTKVVHFRTLCTFTTQFEFKWSGVEVEITEIYKYLGQVLNNHIDKGKMNTEVAKSARSF